MDFKGKTKDNSRRKFPGVGGAANNPLNVQLRRKAAAERDEYWKSLSPKEQLKELDRRLGKGVGAVRQRARLEALIARMEETQPRAEGKRKKGQPARAA